MKISKKKKKKISSQISVRKKGKRKCSPLKRSVFRGIVLASALVIKLFKGLAQTEEQFVLLPHGQAHRVFSKTNLSASVTSGSQDHTTSPRRSGGEGWGILLNVSSETSWQSSGYDSAISSQGAQVQSLVRELRSHRPQGMAKNI